MAVNPYKDKKTGEIEPGVWIIDWWPLGRNGPRRQRRYYGTEKEAFVYWMDKVRSSKRQINTVNPRVLDVLPAWMAEYKNDHLPRTVGDMQQCMPVLIKFFGKLFFAELVPATLEEYKRLRLEAEAYPERKKDPDKPRRTVKPRTINKELSYLAAFLRWAYESGHCAELIRPKRFPAKMTRSPKVRIPSAEALARLIETIEDHYRPICLLMFHGGLRVHEALNIRGAWVRLDHNIIHVTGKGMKERIVPIMSDPLRQALKTALEARPEGYLFINPKTEKPYRDIKKALKRAAKAAGVPEHVHHHLLRHSFGTYALDAGIGIRQVQEYMGHSSITTTEKYVQFLAHRRTEDAAKFNARFGVNQNPTSTADNPKDPNPSE